MKISENGLDLIKKYEGCRLTAYKATKKEPYFTIGWGHYSPDILAGDTITQEQADAILVKDLAKFENVVNNPKYVPFTSALNQNQFDALVSFCYNCGAGNLQCLCSSGINNVPLRIIKYNHSGKVVLAGLVKRRNEEKELFIKPATDYYDVVLDVIHGKYGSGEERKQKLLAAGYDYATIQKLVNSFLKVN